MVSNEFKLAMQEPIKEISGYLLLDDNTKISDIDNLVSFKISVESSMCKTAMRKLEATILGSYDLVGKWIKAFYGVKINGEFVYLDAGSFFIKEFSTAEEKGEIHIIAYDKMIESMKLYVPSNITYPINLLNYTKSLSQACGLELKNTKLINQDLIISKELFENINGITYRDIFSQIAEATATICIISEDKLYFKSITDTNDKLTYNNLFSLKLEPKYGKINSVVLSRQPQEDNIFLKDDESIKENGLTEFKISNNEIVDKVREIAITPIFNELKNIEFYPFQITTEGLGWFEVGDKVTIVDNEANSYPIIVLNYSILIDKSIKETISAKTFNKTSTQYKYATSIEKRIRNAELVVDKQAQKIESTVNEIVELDSKVQENYSKTAQDIENIVNSFQNTNGSNLIKNSVMFFYNNDRKPVDWEVLGDGNIYISSSSESLSAGGISGNVFSLDRIKVKQRISVKKNSNIDDKIYYNFNCKIKKEAIGSGYIKIFNDNEEYKIELVEGQSSFYGDYELSKLQPTMSYYDIEIYGTHNITFTDVMFSLGENKQHWSQANGEVMNSQAQFSIHGLKMFRGVGFKDYTIMSPLEFSGYSEVNGQLKRVFTLNKDTTEVTKIKSSEEIKMNPIKIVPLTTGEVKGWAFVLEEE